MAIEIIQSEDEFLKLNEEWNSLLKISASHVPFLRHEYLRTWWATLGGGEWTDGSLEIILKRDQGMNLQGIAPFFRHKGRILFLGSFEISDYLDLIAPSKSIPDFIDEIFSYLGSPETAPWQSLDLYNLPDDSPTIPSLQQKGAKLGWLIKKEILQPAPTLKLPRTWDIYLDSLDDHYQREIERKMRRAENYFLPVDWYIVENENQLEGELDMFLELMTHNPDKKAFLSEGMIQQMKSSAREAFLAGWLQLAFLTVGDLKAAGYLSFDFNQKLWIYNSGINPLFENISPGWVLLSKIIRWGIEAGKTELDFMRGDEPYKYHFGGEDKQVLHIQVTPF
jgi:hypothetical protein